jgi:hypothetical protein
VGRLSQIRLAHSCAGDLGPLTAWQVRKGESRADAISQILRLPCICYLASFWFLSAMKPVVEYMEIRKNSFTKWLFLLLTILCVFTLTISIDKGEKQQWIMLAGILLFGGGLTQSLTHKITLQQAGFTIKNLGRTSFVQWGSVTALQFEMEYHGHSVEAILRIGAGSKTVRLSVKQYLKTLMQRFFEVLDEQCPSAEKNEHFRKQAAGQMNWKSKLKMF